MANARRAVSTRRERAEEPAIAAPSADQLEQLKLNLQATREKLMLINPDSLDDDAHEAWSNQLFKVSLAINGLRNKVLENLSEQFQRELPALGAAADRLTDDLFRLQRAVDVIKAVDGVLGVFARIIQLVT